MSWSTCTPLFSKETLTLRYPFTNLVREILSSVEDSRTEHFRIPTFRLTGEQDYLSLHSSVAVLPESRRVCFGQIQFFFTHAVDGDERMLAYVRWFSGVKRSTYGTYLFNGRFAHYEVIRVDSIDALGLIGIVQSGSGSKRYLVWQDMVIGCIQGSNVELGDC